MPDFHRFKNAILFIILAFFGVGCHNNPLDVDVSDIECDITISRLDLELAHSKPENLAKLNREWHKKYKDFYEIYLNVLIRVGDVNDTLTLEAMKKMLADPWVKMINADIEKEFKDIGWLESELEEAFKHVKYYYPETKVPAFVAANTLFKRSVSFTDDIVAIGFERYLGEGNRVVKRIPSDENGIFQYEKVLMRSEYISVDVMRNWFELNKMKEPADRDFLSHIIHQGKILYALDAIFPNMEDKTKIRYSSDQLEWCEKSEASIWQFLVDKDLLRATLREKINDFIMDGPFTMGGLPRESPPRVGCWLGWKIVRSYMEEHPDLKLPDLINEKNAWKILKSYNPPK
jgi:hypothetical protein